MNALDDYGNDYDEYGLDDYSDYPGGRQMLFGDSPFALQKKDEETLGKEGEFTWFVYYRKRRINGLGR